MRFFSVAVYSFALARTNALINIPAVSSVVSSALEEYSVYVTAAFAEATAGPLAHKDTRHSQLQARQAVTDPEYWLADITHQGIAAFNSDPSSYAVFRNVKDYGAAGTLSLPGLFVRYNSLTNCYTGDGVTDDTAAINAAISDGGRFGPSSGETSTTTPAIVYFPAGTYIISSSIIDYYYTQLKPAPYDQGQCFVPGHLAAGW